MAKKGPKTLRGQVRKTFTGDGRKSTAKPFRDIEKDVTKTMRKMEKEMSKSLLGKKKKK